MGKFYKILKILCMIIFIFTFLSRVFAISDPVNITINNVDYGVNFEYLVSNYNYYYVFYTRNSTASQGVRTYFFVVCSNSPFTFTYNNPWINIVADANDRVDIYKLDCYESYYTLANAFNKWNEYTLSASNGNNYVYYSTATIGLTINQSINSPSMSQRSNVFSYADNTLYSNFDIKDSNGNVVINNNIVSNPYIVNSSEISDWSFDSLEINLGSQEPDALNDYLWVSYNGNNNSIFIYTQLLEDYDSETNTYYISKQKLSNYIHFVEDAEINFTYQKNTQNDGLVDIQNLGTYNVLLDTSVVNDLNNNSEQNFRNDMYNGITNIETSISEGNAQTHDDLQQINNTMTDSTVESTADDLPSTDVDDPSESGIDNIFQSIYNAFCTGQAQNIVFPIPFTNKNITLSPYYVRDMLNNNGAGWVYTLIQAFWGYLIGRYIVKDISKKITKIKGGNIENIENENIKEEML